MTKAEFADACRAFAIAHIPELERAATERYDVTSSVLRWVCDRVGELHPSGDKDDVFVLINPTRKVEVSEQRSPDEAAFRLLGYITHHVDQVPRPDGATVKVGRIQRVYRRLEREVPLKYTAVEVVVEGPGVAPRRVFLDAEWEA